MSREFTKAEIASHNSVSDLWIIVNGKVYDVTEFQKTHPGGIKVLRGVGGKDATKSFLKHHKETVLRREHYLYLCIGTIVEKKVEVIEEGDEEEEGTVEVEKKANGGGFLGRLKKIVARKEVPGAVESGVALKET